MALPPRHSLPIRPLGSAFLQTSAPAPPTPPSAQGGREPHLLDKFGFLPRVLLSRRRASKKTPCTRKRWISLIKSYSIDWFAIIFMGVLFSIIDRLDGFQRQFDINDATIQFPHAATERVPMSALVLISVLFPILFIISFSQFALRSSWDTHTGLLGLALSLSLTLVTTVMVKLSVGRPRPDMISRCQPFIDPKMLSAPSFLIIHHSPSSNMTFGLSDSSICTADRSTREFKDGFRSFPSGHSSTAWAGLSFLSFYMAGKLRLFNIPKGHQYSIKIWISISPLLGATMISISRTMDYRHHWEDVLIGGLMGLALSYFAYKYYYYPLSSDRSHLPYPPRVKSHDPEDLQDLEAHGGRVRRRERTSSSGSSLGERRSHDSRCFLMNNRLSQESNPNLRDALQSDPTPPSQYLSPRSKQPPSSSAQAPSILRMAKLQEGEDSENEKEWSRAAASSQSIRNQPDPFKMSQSAFSDPGSLSNLQAVQLSPPSPSSQFDTYNSRNLPGQV